MKVSGAWMHHHTCRFVYHQEFVVFINDIERNILCLNGVFVSRSVEHQSDNVFRPYFIVAFYRMVVYMHKTRICRFLNTVATAVLQLVGHKLINAHGHLPLVYNDAQMFVQQSRFVVLFFYFFYIVSHPSYRVYRFMVLQAAYFLAVLPLQTRLHRPLLPPFFDLVDRLGQRN